MEEGGVYVDFFKVPVPISRAAANLALHLRLPVRLIFCRWEPARGKYYAYCLPEMLPVSGVSAEDFTRQIVAGMQQFYKPEELVGKDVVVVVNLAWGQFAAVCTHVHVQGKPELAQVARARGAP